MQAKVALMDALPCLLDLTERARSEADDGDGRLDEQHCFSVEYLQAVQQDVVEIVQEELLQLRLDTFDDSVLQAIVMGPHLFFYYMMERQHREAIADAAEKVGANELRACDPDVAR